MEVNPKPTPEGDVPGDYPGKTKPSRPFIGDVPGEGSEGPTDIPNKEVHPNRPYPLPDEPYPLYRGHRPGRGGHFDKGHQRYERERTSPIDEHSSAQERYERERLMGPIPYSKDDPNSRAGGYTGPYPAGDPTN